MWKLPNLVFGLFSRDLGIDLGVGGSRNSQVNAYVRAIVTPYRPQAVVLYAGDNDLSFPALKPRKLS